MLPPYKETSVYPALIGCSTLPLAIPLGVAMAVRARLVGRHIR